MTQLIAFYDEEPVDLKGRVELHQSPLADAAQSRSVDGAIRRSVVYLEVPNEAGPFLVPFGEYDEWSLRDRYNEAIRIMNTLGASVISCQTFREVSVRRGFRAKVFKQRPELAQQRVENSGFDFHHTGAGSVARDPRPLRWSDEPGFAAAVSSVLENQASEVTINIRSHRRYSVDGALGLQFKKLGFELGGNSERSGDTTLHIRAEFPQAAGRSQQGWGWR